VETDELLQFLKGEGCAELQGFGIGRPAPIDAHGPIIGGPPTARNRSAVAA